MKSGCARTKKELKRPIYPRVMTLLVPKDYRVNTLKHFRDPNQRLSLGVATDDLLEWRDDKDPEKAVLESNEILKPLLLSSTTFYHDMKLLKSFLSLIFLLTLVSVVSADEPQTTAV